MGERRLRQECYAISRAAGLQVTVHKGQVGLWPAKTDDRRVPVPAPPVSLSLPNYRDHPKSRTSVLTVLRKR